MTAKQERLQRVFQAKVLDKKIFQDHDRFGSVQVVDEERIRSLHFDSIEKQSAMDLENPVNLVLTYTVAMMAGLLLNPNASHFLCIGLGGGSIPKFLLNHLPDCQVDIIELRKLVIEIARDYFGLQQDHRMTLYAGDGRDFVISRQEKRYDYIFVDAYSDHGISEAVTDAVFIESAHSILNPGGIFAINLWSEPKKVFKSTLKVMKKIFSNQVLFLPVSDRTNRIVFGWTAPSAPLSMQHLKNNMIHLERKLKLGYPELVTTLIKNNRPFFKQFD